MARTADKPRPVGRPPKPPGEARRSATGVSLSERELARLRRLAARARKTLSQYIRDHLPL